MAGLAAAAAMLAVGASVFAGMGYIMLGLIRSWPISGVIVLAFMAVVAGVGIVETSIESD